MIRPDEGLGGRCTVIVLREPREKYWKSSRLLYYQVAALVPLVFQNAEVAAKQWTISQFRTPAAAKSTSTWWGQLGFVGTWLITLNSSLAQALVMYGLCVHA